MKSKFLQFAAAGLVLFALGSVANVDASGDEPKAKAKDVVAEVTVADAASKLKTGTVAVDANGESTRARFGTVPGAVLLSSYRDFKPTELPADKATSLVFYCANTHCTASDAAALRAKTHGYTAVAVMRAGIAGWKDAGQPVAAYKTAK